MLQLQGVAFLFGQTGDVGQRSGWLVCADAGQRPRQGDAGHVAERGPVLVGQTRHLQRVAGDHLEREVRLGSRGVDRLHHARQVQDAVAERHFREEESGLHLLHPHVLEVHVEGVGRELFHALEPDRLARVVVVRHHERNAHSLGEQHREAAHAHVVVAEDHGRGAHAGPFSRIAWIR